MQVILIAVLDICFGKKTRESVLGTFRNICTVAVYSWYIKDASVGFCQQIFKKNFRSYFRENCQKTFVTLSRFWLLRGWGVWVNPLKKENLRQKSFLDNVEWSCKKL